MKTKRHHYIPQFLIRNFTNNDKKITIYDKLKDDFFESVTNNIFVETDRNSFSDFDGKKNDNIEKLYANLDSIFSVTIEKVIASESLDGEDLGKLILLAYTQKWRVPQYQKALENAISAYSFSDLGLRVKQKDKIVDVNLENIFNSLELQQVKRFFLALQPFRFSEEYQKIFSKTVLLSTPLTALLSDCPFMESQLSTEIIFEDFIFPIHEHYTLIFSKSINKEDFLAFQSTERFKKFLFMFSTSRDAMSIGYADRFIGCSDEKYLKIIVNNYKNYIIDDGKKNTLFQAAFELINNYKKDIYYEK